MSAHMDGGKDQDLQLRTPVRRKVDLQRSLISKRKERDEILETREGLEGKTEDRRRHGLSSRPLLRQR